ncbi:MAG: hypothetical protein M5F18_07330 [Asgard group archaeon]|nr:hypothetical protein [Asgard group archaeon]
MSQGNEMKRKCPVVLWCSNDGFATVPRRSSIAIYKTCGGGPISNLPNMMSAEEIDVQ